MLWLLYVVYLAVRASIENRQRRAVVGAVYGIVAFLDVPLVYLSTRLLGSQGDLHPVAEDHQTTSMKLTLALYFVPVTMMTAGLIAARFRLTRLERARRDAARAAEELEPGLPMEHGPAGAASGGAA